MKSLKSLITEEKVLKELLGEQQFKSLSNREKQEIYEVADLFRSTLSNAATTINRDKQLLRELRNCCTNSEYSAILEEGIFDKAKAQFAGLAAGAKQIGQNISGEDAADPKTAAKLKMINSRLNSFKKNIGTASAQYKKDIDKLGMNDNPLFAKLFQFLSQELKKGPTEIEIKDSSVMNKIAGVAGGLSKAAIQKMMPIVQKIMAEFSKKADALYQKSGPLKNFDDQYKQLVGKFKQANPGIADAMTKFSKIAVKHKKKATFIVGGMVGILTAAGVAGPAAPLIMGIGMRGLYGLLAGEPPAKAFGKAAITALAGKLVGGGIKDLFGGLFDGISMDGAGDAADAAGGAGDAAGEAGSDFGGDAGADVGELNKVSDKYGFEDYDEDMAKEFPPKRIAELESKLASSLDDPRKISSLANEFGDGDAAKIRQWKLFMEGNLKRGVSNEDLAAAIIKKKGEYALEELESSVSDLSPEDVGAGAGGEADAELEDMQGSGSSVEDLKSSSADWLSKAESTAGVDIDNMPDAVRKKLEDHFGTDYDAMNDFEDYLKMDPDEAMDQMKSAGVTADDWKSPSPLDDVDAEESGKSLGKMKDQMADRQGKSWDKESDSLVDKETGEKTKFNDLESGDEDGSTRIHPNEKRLDALESKTGISGKDAHEMGLQQAPKSSIYSNRAEAKMGMNLKQLAMNNPEIAEKLGFDVEPTGEGKAIIRGGGKNLYKLQKLSRYYNIDSLVSAIKDDPSNIDKLLSVK